MAPVLQLDNLRTEFRMRDVDRRGCRRVSFDVDEGECVGIVGESGCGKTTTGLSIMRLLPGNGHITGGVIKLLGRDLADFDEKQMRKVRGNEVALIPQDPMTSLNPTMSIGHQIAEGVRLHRDVTHQEARQRAIETLRLVEMPQPTERIDQYPHELSGGLRQRVMIAMALACEPKLLIADEPTTALDVTIQAQILNLIDELRQRLSMAVVLITHDMGVIAGRTDRVVVMYAGKIAEEAETGQLFHRIRHPYSEALLASVPRLDHKQDERLLSITRLTAGPVPNHHQLPIRTPLPVRHRPVPQRGPAAGRHGIRASGHPSLCLFPSGRPQHEQRPIPVEVTAKVRAEQSARAESLVTADNILEVRDVVKEFPVMSGTIFRHQTGSVKAVSNVTFDIRRGETFGLVGESGCGKTTLGHLIVALDRVTSGSVTFDGVEMSSLSGRDLRARRRDLQLMFQDPYASLDPRMRVGSIIREPLKVHGVGSAGDQAERVRSLLGEVGLSEDSVDRYPHEFFGRPAATHRTCPRPGPRSETDRGRRAGFGARRFHSGPDPQPHEGSPDPTRSDLRDDLP